MSGKKSQLDVPDPAHDLDAEDSEKLSKDPDSQVDGCAAASSDFFHESLSVSSVTSTPFEKFKKAAANQRPFPVLRCKLKKQVATITRKCSPGLFPVNQSLEFKIYADMPKCKKGEELSPQMDFPRRCPCEVNENGEKFLFQPNRAKVKSGDLRGYVADCCNDFHYHPVELQLEYGIALNIPPMKAFLTNCGIARLLKIDASNYWHAFNTEEQKKKHAEEKELCFFALHKCLNPDLLCFVHDKILYVCGMSFV